MRVSLPFLLFIYNQVFIAIGKSLSKEVYYGFYIPSNNDKKAIVLIFYTHVILFSYCLCKCLPSITDYWKNFILEYTIRWILHTVKFNWNKIPLFFNV